MAGQIDILHRWLTEILFLNEEEYKPSSVIIKRIIKKHQNIIIFSENLENLYSPIALILFVSDTLIICFVGFVLVVVSILIPEMINSADKSVYFQIPKFLRFHLIIVYHIENSILML